MTTHEIKARIANLKPERTVIFRHAGEVYAHIPSDLTITCRSYTFVAHQRVLESKIDFVKKALEAPFKESLERNLNVSAQDPSVVQAILHHAYYGNYTDRGANEPDHRSPLTFNAMVYALGEEWQAVDVKREAILKVRDRIPFEMWGDDIMTAIKVVYTSTPGFDRPLRQCIAEATCLKWNKWGANASVGLNLQTAWI